MIRMVDPKLLRMRSAWSPWKDGIDAEKPPGAEYRAHGPVGIVRVRGVVGEECYDDCHPDDLIAAIDRARQDEATTVAVLELDSPGGSVDRFGDIGAALARLAASKPLHAVAHDKMASLAYWMATYARNIVATSSAVVGSIGVVMDVQDTSAMMGSMGVKVIPVTDAPAKLAGMPGVAQGEDQVEAVRAMVLPMGRRFREAVARARAMAPEAVAALQGRAMFGPEAMEVGLVDRVVVFDEWINQLAGGSGAEAPAGETGRGARVAAHAAKKAVAARAPARAKARVAGRAGGAPTGARAMTEKELMEKYPDRKDEIKGRMARAAREMDEELSAEDGPVDEQDAAAEDGQVDEQDAAAEDGQDDAKAQDGQDDAKAENGQDEEAKAAGGRPAAQGGQSGPGRAAATLAELKALGCDSDFIVLAMEQGYTAAQAKGTWAAMGKARAQAGRPNAGGVPAVSAGRQTPPPSDGAAGVGRQDLDGHAFAKEARAMAKSRGMTIVQAELQLKKDKPELYADYEALEKQRAQAIHERRLKMVV